jgi:hypothetical protein
VDQSARAAFGNGERLPVVREHSCAGLRQGFAHRGIDDIAKPLDSFANHWPRERFALFLVLAQRGDAQRYFAGFHIRRNGGVCLVLNNIPQFVGKRSTRHAENAQFHASRGLFPLNRSR